MTKPHELKPCPHCGSATAPMFWSYGEMMDTYDVELELDHSESFCVVCDASTGGRGGCGASGGFMPTKEEAVAAWNRRA